MALRRTALALVALVGCRATTARPPFVPFPEAEHTEIGFGLEDKVQTVEWVTDTLVAYLRADSIPIERIRRFDGYFETPWFDAATLQPTGRRPLGDGVVRVRAWVDPSKPGFARVDVETAFIPLADPSLPARELEAPVIALHPVNRRIGNVLQQLKGRYGLPDEDSTKVIKPVNRPPPLPADTTKQKADSAAVVPAKPDSLEADTTIRVPPTPVKPAAPPDTAKVDSAAVVPKPVPTTPIVAADAKGIWVQAVAASTGELADEIVVKVRAAGFEPVIARRGPLFLVRVGPFATRAAAAATLGKIKAQVGGEPFVVVNP